MCVPCCAQMLTNTLIVEVLLIYISAREILFSASECNKAEFPQSFTPIHTRKAGFSKASLTKVFMVVHNTIDHVANQPSLLLTLSLGMRWDMSVEMKKKNRCKP